MAARGSVAVRDFREIFGENDDDTSTKCTKCAVNGLAIVLIQGDWILRCKIRKSYISRLDVMLGKNFWNSFVLRDDGVEQTTGNTVSACKIVDCVIFAVI